VRKIDVFSKQSSPCKSRLRVQPEQHNNYVKIEVFHKRLISTKAHNLNIQITVTYTQRGHHILHWLNLRDDTHLPVVEQHYPQVLTLKKISQLPLHLHSPQSARTIIPVYQSRPREDDHSPSHYDHAYHIVTIHSLSVSQPPFAAYYPVLAPRRPSEPSTCGEGSAAATSNATK
jgi:hypothetical protein